GSRTSKYRQKCLRDALEGLHALSYGEVQPIFAPRKTDDQGVTPYSVRKFRIIAVGFVDLLCKKGMKSGKARAKVAAAYCLGRADIKSWEHDKDIGKTQDPWMKSFKQKIANSTEWDEVQLNQELAQAGASFLKANKKKKSK